MGFMTKTQQMEFLCALRGGESVTEASRHAGVSRRSVYYLKSEDPEFAGAWDAAVDESTDILQAEVFKRALDRSDPKSHIMLIFELKKRIPEYKENFRKEVTIHHDRVNEVNFSAEEIDEAVHILKAAQRKKQKQPLEADE